MTRSEVSKGAAEAIGTFAIVFAGCGAIMLSNNQPSALPPGAIPVVFGLVVTVMIYAVGHISGAHFNPAVTAAFAVARHFPLRLVVLYWVAQTVGAFAAIGLLAFLFPESTTFGATIPSVDPFRALIWEIVLTFFLMFVITAVATDTRAVGVMAGVAIGGTVALDAFIGGPMTGASMNPARSLAPAIASGNFSGLWIYLIGPMIGAALAAKVYERIRCESKPAEGEAATSSGSAESSGSKDAKGCC